MFGTKLDVAHEPLVSDMPSESQVQTTPKIKAAEIDSSARKVIDIKTLREEKNPSTANQMALIVAYYLSEKAGAGEKKDSINADDIEKYFKQASFTLPRKAKYTLVNAKNAGYLEALGGGEYKLNPVGYNLVVHKLPSKNTGSVSSSKRKKIKSMVKKHGSNKKKTKK
ncbi:MAG: hypothetical protein V1936_01395 [Patescibacteria group bacterium]